MASQSKSLVLFLAVLLLLVGGLGAWLVLAPGGGEDEAVLARPGGVPASAAEPVAETVLRSVQLPDIEDFGEVETTVAWPVELELELVRSLHFPTLAGVQPIGSGRKARLRGSLTGSGAEGVPCEVHFLEGTNRGRVITSDAAGQFGATDLYPGLQLVVVRGRGMPAMKREVRLRKNAEALLHLSYGLRGGVVGTVYRRDTEPLAGVQVDLGGEKTVTDEDGVFSFPSVPPGREVPIVLSKQGYATHTELIGVAAGFSMKIGRLAFLMQEAATLEIVLKNKVGGTGDTLVALVPANDRAQRDFPWYTVGPRKIGAGNRLRIEGLPPEQILIHLFHEGAIFSPPVSSVTLHEGQEKAITVAMEPAPRLAGTVLDAEGEPVAGARVALEPPDRVAATLAYFGKMPTFLETAALPLLPVALQETRTDDEGRFLLSANERFAPNRYLQAWGPDGKLWACRIVGTGEEQVELRLAPIEEGEGTLSIDFKKRYQGLPIEVVINGQPAHEGVLPPGRPLVLANLAEGIWRARARWNGEVFYEEDGLELQGTLAREAFPPEGAIDGQDEQTLLRAGKL